MEESSLRNQTIYSFSYWCRMVSNLCCFHFYRTHVYNVSVTRTNYTILHNFTFQLEFRIKRPIQYFFEESIQLPAARYACWLFGRPFLFSLFLFFSVLGFVFVLQIGNMNISQILWDFKSTKLFVAWTQYDNNWNTIISIEMRSQL